MTPSTESPRVGGNLLMASCLLLCFGSAFLGFAGLWAPYGPSLMSTLFLIAAGPVIAFGKRAKVETVGWRTLAVMSAVACDLVFSSFLNAGIMRSPQNVGEGATGGFMFFAALQMWAFLRIMRRNMPELVEGLNPQIALSAAAAAGAAGYWGVFALAIFCAFIPLAGLWFRAKGWRVDVTNLFASCARGGMRVVALLPVVVSGCLPPRLLPRLLPVVSGWVLPRMVLV